jgi:Protein of unknown function (DUF1761)
MAHHNTGRTHKPIMTPNPLILGAAALIPFLFAMIWFHKNLFGGAHWVRIVGLTPEQAAKTPKPTKMLLTVLLNFFVAFGLYSVCVHQSGVFSIVGGDAALLKTGTGAAFMAEYGGNFLTLKHGLFHGFLASLSFAMPLLGYVTIFEHKSAKYFWVNQGYWTICMMCMAAVICRWGATAV